ncbi:conserved hypothetical protein [Candidatus Terasakiella magnetica]|uniref:Histidine kinase/HSP90-like ATPase domain-containing protein n=1 Tax=Candidatus Terasakiella magnetica TaxID=1867952 RepID=A0A1C3RJR7_9PROT|nr:SiaB family protein kinase [Candidatus Terasakiella magnetica]SCA57515.1 conserved hypothetical protein [Candidatus Terasakiella magnetica]
MLSLKGLHDDMLQNDITFCFTGFMSEEMILGVGKTLRHKIELEELDKRASRDLFSIFIEMTQNVIRYSAKNQIDNKDPVEIDLRYGALSIGEKDNRKFVACGNLVHDEHVERLRNSLSYIQSLSQQELKQHFKECLKKDVPETSKGAGVGFIEIARRAKHGFEFHFEEATNDNHFFTLTAYI